MTLRQGMSQDPKPKDWDLFGWLTSGPWYNFLLKILAPVLVILVLFCVFTTCILPCLKNQVQKLISGTVNVMLEEELTILLGEQLSQANCED